MGARRGRRVAHHAPDLGYRLARVARPPLRRSRRRPPVRGRVVSDGVTDPPSPAGAPSDPLHATSAPSVRWTRANAEEIFPAAITHLTWSLVGKAGERGWRMSFHDAGILPRSEIEVPDDPSRRAFSIFYGRPAFNFEYLAYYAFAAFSSSDTDAA